jgi:hypothetical protein
MNAIEIWAPRWRDRVALVASYKVLPGRNLIRFTKAGSYNGIYVINGDDVKKCPLETNGRIDCFAVPLARLEKVSI